ncbi:hypothetical protein L2E82_18526 [Cichorium intybus]|uniref:Uncharacterized protein n=1 Tax=Cichorium intybus TaxID=13427 RepID=A0ACB9FAF2_CICIN|nr:hypothetical protein L2E82_18526 [Cichorium intybus]
MSDVMEGEGCKRGGLRSTKYLILTAEGEGGGGGGRQKAPPGINTRIYWENDDDGWFCGSTTTGTTESAQEDQTNNLLGEKFSELLNNSTDSHYQFLGLPAKADLEEIKAAYRRLSKEYHPDTTSFPLKTASEMFLRLREVYERIERFSSCNIEVTSPPPMAFSIEVVKMVEFSLIFGFVEEKDEIVRVS